ncbi:MULTISPECIES: hypothetical protein [unclassified Pseudomonas]|uniref:hypothetical protein n=1 Tax=unclassified Pseudomonas TaxID=196821 RepID=UPI0012E7928B|nr:MULTISPECIES: hypothetical protein [unclassified Pseudomonas]
MKRIGQEVLVYFINGDIDRPIISKALYNGRGEGGERQLPFRECVAVLHTSLTGVF